MKIFKTYLLLALLIVASVAQGRVFNSTEEITLQPAVGFNVDFISPSLSASQPLKLGAAKELVTGTIDLTSEVNGILPIANGGTGSATQNFVDLSTDQSVSGSKTFTRKFIASSTTEGYIPCPVMTEAQRDATTPADGDCVFNDDTNKLNVYSGTGWEEAGGGGLNKWVTGTVYLVDDVVWESASEQIYRANTGHTASASFSTDIANWDKLAYEDGLTDTQVTFGNAGGTIAQDAELTYDATGNILTVEDLLVDTVEYVSGSAPAAPASGSLKVYTDSTSGLLSQVDSNGVARSVKDFKQSDVISNPSFEDSHAGAPALGWTLAAGTPTVVTSGLRVTTEGAQALQVALTAESLALSQTFNCSSLAATPVGFTAYVKTALAGVQVCGFDGTNDINCVDVSTDNTQKQYVAENTGGGTCGIKIKSGSTTGAVLVDGVKFTDQPYRFVDISTVTEFSTPEALTIGAVTTPPTLGTVEVNETSIRQVGSEGEIRINLRTSTGGGAGSGHYLYTLPDGKSFKTGTSFYTGSDKQANHVDSFTGLELQHALVSSVVLVVPYDATRYRLQVGPAVGDGGTGSGAAANYVGSADFSTAQSFRIKGTFSAPIDGFSAENKHVVTPLNSNLTDWIAYTPTLTGFGATPTAVDFYYKQVGDSYHIQGVFTSDTTTAVEAQLSLPNSKTVRSGMSVQHVGTWIRGFTTTQNGGVVQVTGGDSFVTFSQRDTFSTSGGSHNPLSSSLGTNMAISGNEISVNAIIPIEGLSSEATIVGAFPFDRVQTKILSSDVTANGVTLTDVTFNNLVIGKMYNIGGQFRLRSNAGGNNPQVGVDINNGGTQVGSVFQGIDTANGGFTHPHMNLTFKATAATLTFVSVSAAPASPIEGDGTLAESFVTLTENNTTKATTQF